VAAGRDRDEEIVAGVFHRGVVVFHEFQSYTGCTLRSSCPKS
jgi:hypothetical protein